MFDKQYYVYILCNPRNTVLYIGVTNDLIRRVSEHKQKVLPGFASKYNCIRLIYFEETTDIMSALEREKQLKRWNRRKKEWLINRDNPKWEDLYDRLLA